MTNGRVSDQPRPRDHPWGLLAAALVILVTGLAEVTAQPWATARIHAALEACGPVESVDVSLGRRPHVLGLLSGRMNDVAVSIRGMRVGPVVIDSVDVDVDHVSFPRRRLLGMGGAMRLENGLVHAVVTEDDLDAWVEIPLASVRVTVDGIVVVVLGARIDVLLTVEDGALELRLADESLPALRLDPPAGVEVVGVTAQERQIAVLARLPASIEPGVAC